MEMKYVPGHGCVRGHERQLVAQLGRRAQDAQGVRGELRVRRVHPSVGQQRVRRGARGGVEVACHQHGDVGGGGDLLQPLEQRVHLCVCGWVCEYMPHVEKYWPESSYFLLLLKHVARVMTVGSCLHETVSAVRCLGISPIARRTASERHAARSLLFP